MEKNKKNNMFQFSKNKTENNLNNETPVEETFTKPEFTLNIEEIGVENKLPVLEETILKEEIVVEEKTIKELSVSELKLYRRTGNLPN